MEEYSPGTNPTLDEIYHAIEEMNIDDDSTSELESESASLDKLFDEAVHSVKDALDQMKPAVKKANITAYLRLNKLLLGLQLWGDDIRVEKKTPLATVAKAPGFESVASRVRGILSDISEVSPSLRERDPAPILSG